MIQAENELLQHISETQLSETQPTEILRLAQEELAQLQKSADEEDVYEDAYANYTAHTSPWSPCRDPNDEEKANPGDLKDDSAL